MKIKTDIKITKDESLLRLDSWLKFKFKKASYSTIQKLIRKGSIKVNNKKVIASYKLHQDMIVSLPPSILETNHTKYNNKIPNALFMEMKTRILYESNTIIVFNKPFGLATQGGSGIKVHLNSIINFMSKDKKESYRLVHRLDKHTSGIIIVAKNRTSARNITFAFKMGFIKKTYWAIVIGIPKKKQGKINFGLTKQTTMGKEKIITTKTNGFKSETLYRVIKSYKGLSWLELFPLTGRTHQIRAHCSAIGFPILGDNKYRLERKFNVDTPQYHSNKMHLCAKKIEMKIADEKKINIVSPLPEHMKETFRELNFSEKIERLSNE